jgi:putative membrane protein
MSPTNTPDYEAQSFRLSSSRTALSLHRTRMSADRTLMAIIRTALSLLSFGFTIFQFFRYMRETVLVGHTLPAAAPRRFGLALVLLGNLLLFLGIWNHIKFMLQLRSQREKLLDENLVSNEIPFPISVTLIVAVLLLMIGVGAVLDMVLRNSS